MAKRRAQTNTDHKQPADAIGALEAELAHSVDSGQPLPDGFVDGLNALVRQAEGRAGPNGRSEGVCYTPPALVDVMCRRTLGALHAEIWPDGSDASPDYQVCDPAAGAGEFLVGMLEAMADATSRQSGDASEQGRFESMRHIARDCLYGVETNAEAVRLTRLRLRLAVREQALRAGVRLTRPFLPELDSHIVQGDSLLGKSRNATAPPPPPFPEVRERGGFDGVIGNPPYVSFGMRGRKSSNASWAEKVRSFYPRSAEYKISTYALFFELGLAWLRDGGALCYVTPDSFLSGRYFSKLRALLRDETALREIVLFESDFWTSRTVGRPVVTLAVKRGASSPVHNTRATSPEALQGGRAHTHERAPEAMFAGERARLRLLYSDEAERFVETVERDARPLGDYLRIVTGMRSRTDQKALISEESRDGDDWRRGLVSGAQVRPFDIDWRGHYLHIDPTQLYSGGHDPEIVERPKILIRQTGDSLIAALDVSDHYYHLNNIHSAAPRHADVPLRYICALLNSRLMNRYYQLVTLEEGRALAQTRIDVLMELPIRIPGPKDLRQIDALWERIDDAAREEIERIAQAAYCL